MENSHTIDRNTLLSPFMKLSGLATKHFANPILVNVMVELTPQGSKIIATDLETCAIINLAATPEKPSTFLVHASKFTDMIKALDDGDIDLTVNKASMKVQQKSATFSLVLQDVTDFPEIPSTADEGAKITVKADVLRNAFDKVDFAASRDKTRYIMTGVYLKFRGNQLLSVATDGFRLSCYGQFIDDQVTIPGFVIPRSVIGEIRNIILSDAGEEQITILKTEKKAIFKTSKATLVSNLIEGTFPDYETVIPRDNKYVISVERDSLLKGIKKVAPILSKSEPITIKVSSGSMEISLESELGRAKETVDIVYTGPEFKHAFNIKFLLDLLPKIPDERIIIQAPAEYQAYLFKGESSTNYMNVIMPIRL